MSAESPYEALARKYCPPLDESLVIVLAGDYDLENSDSRKELEQILDDLKKQAVVEQELEFAVPAGVANLQNIDNEVPSQTTSQTGTTDLGENVDSITTGLSDLHTSSDGAYIDFEPELPEGLESGSVADKEKWLKILFPTIEPIQITETIAKCGGSVQKSIDELLNLSFIHDDIDENYVRPPVLKGVDGFAEGTTKSKTKGRRKKGNNQVHVTNEVSQTSKSAPNNIWKNTAQDVDFIVSRTNLSESTVTSLYHKNNNNLAMTIRALIVKEADLHAAEIQDDEIVQLQAVELKLELEGFGDASIFGALILARMIPSAARDLLEATVQQGHHDNHKTGKLIGIAQYTPINLSEDEAPVKKKAIHEIPMGDAASLMGQAGVHSIDANRAFSQASSAYRRGKSDHLMGGAAAYYASVGNEKRQRQKALMASAASAHVNQQSSSTVLDLHGVSVEHAIMLSRTRVAVWWEGLGDRKYVVGGIGNGYKIITGVGKHSVGGVGKIGPAVSKTLINEGWRVNVQRGEIIIEGRARR